MCVCCMYVGLHDSYIHHSHGSRVIDTSISDQSFYKSVGSFDSDPPACIKSALTYWAIFTSSKKIFLGRAGYVQDIQNYESSELG